MVTNNSKAQLQPLAYSLPGPVIPVLGHPVTRRVIGLLGHGNVARVVTALRCLPSIVQSCFRSNRSFNIRVACTIRRSRPLKATNYMGGVTSLLSSAFLMVDNSDIASFSLRTTVHFRQRGKSGTALILAHIPGPVRFKMIVAGSRNRVRHFLRGPSADRVFSSAIGANACVLRPRILSCLPTGRRSSFSGSLFPLLLSGNRPLCNCITSNC